MTENQKELLFNYIFPLKYLWTSKNVRWYVRPLLTPLMILWTPTAGILGALIFFTVILPLIWVVWLIFIK